jgi:MoaA/NifB/PqqE/SkfB family radical SAM enzyme
LSNFFSKEGENKLFQFLKANHKNYYQPQEKILIVQDCNDLYEFDANPSTPGKALIFLQESLQQIDISNNFVCILSGNPDINLELKTLQKSYSTDNLPIDFFKINVPYSKQTKKYDTFCVLPWIHLFTSSNAKMYPCCWSNFDMPFGDILKQPISEIINNEKFNDLRKNMLSQQKTKSCETCYLIEENGNKSHRQRKNEKYKDYIPLIKEQTNLNGSISKFAPIDVNLTLNNTCNLKCRTCSGVASSKIAREEKILYNYSKNFDQLLNNTQKTQAASRFFKYLSSARQISFAGGEPSLQIEQYQILDELIKLKHTDLKLSYNINCTTLGIKGYNLLDYWKYFSDVQVIASLDGVEEKFEYIRSGANWNTVKQNFLKIKDNCPTVKLKVNSVVSFISVESIIKLQKEWHQENILDINEFNIQLMLENSGYFDVRTLPDKHKKNLEVIISQHCDWLKTQNAGTLLEQWNNVLTYMYSSDQTYILPQLYRDIQLKDKFRQQDFFSVFPEFADIFEQ